MKNLWFVNEYGKENKNKYNDSAIITFRSSLAKEPFVYPEYGIVTDRSELFSGPVNTTLQYLPLFMFNLPIPLVGLQHYFIDSHGKDISLLVSFIKSETDIINSRKVFNYTDIKRYLNLSTIQRAFKRKYSLRKDISNLYMLGWRQASISLLEYIREIVYTSSMGYGNIIAPFQLYPIKFGFQYISVGASNICSIVMDQDYRDEAMHNLMCNKKSDPSKFKLVISSGFLFKDLNIADQVCDLVSEMVEKCNKNGIKTIPAESGILKNLYPAYSDKDLKSYLSEGIDPMNKEEEIKERINSLKFELENAEDL